METYDVECQVSFERAISDAERAAFRLVAQGGKHPGWYGPRPVVSWKSPAEASVFLVLKGPTDGGSAPEEAVCHTAEAQVSGWLVDAGIETGQALGGPSLKAIAIPRV